MRDAGNHLLNPTAQMGGIIACPSTLIQPNCLSDTSLCFPSGSGASTARFPPTPTSTSQKFTKVSALNLRCNLHDTERMSTSEPPPSMSKLARIATFLAVTCTIFNLAYLAYMAIPFLLHEEPDLASLPRPNQFIGLERINYTKYPFPNDKIATFAGVIAQVDRSRPKYIYPVDPRRRSTYFGTVSPDDRNVLATNQVCLHTLFPLKKWR